MLERPGTVTLEISRNSIKHRSAPYQNPYQNLETKIQLRDRLQIILGQMVFQVTCKY